MYAQGSFADLYGQMGGIVVLTETCLKTNNLKIALFKKIRQVFLVNLKWV